MLLLSDVCSQTIHKFAIVKSQNWNLLMECDQTLLHPFDDKWKQAMKQRGGVPAYLNLYNIVNWTTTYEPTATLEELISISLFNSVYALRKVSRIVYVVFFSISITYNYLLIFYDILVFTMYKTRTTVFIVTIKLAIRKKQTKRLHTTLERKIIGEIK